MRTDGNSGRIYLLDKRNMSLSPLSEYTLVHLQGSAYGWHQGGIGARLLE